MNQARIHRGDWASQRVLFDSLGNSSENSATTLLQSAAAAVSEDLQKRVTLLFESILRPCYESEEELSKAVQESTLEQTFCFASQSYARLAVSNSHSINDDPLKWAQQH